MTVALGAALVASASTTAAGSEPVTPDAEAVVDSCPGGFIAVPAAVSGGPTMCTHGPDPSVTPEQLLAEGGRAPEASAGIQCYGNGTSGERVQLLYVYASVNRINTFRPWIEDRAASIDAMYDLSAQQTGGHRYVRWLTDAQCNLSITAVNLASTDLAIGAFSSGLIPKLDALGYDNPNRKYLIWADTGTPTTIGSGSCSGVGTLYVHDVPSAADNFNNRFGGYTRVDDKCLFPLFDAVAGKVEAHELMHTLGAVQPSAPHATIYGHCRDDYDIMCYVDGPGTSLISPRPCNSSGNELRLDCNHDDYFSTNPPSGSYLATRWNAANSDWLEAEPGAPQRPGAPPSLAAAPGDQQVTLTWVKPTYTGGSDVLGYRVYRDDVLLPIATTTPTTTGANLITTTTFTDTTAANGQIHAYQVAAVNQVGEGARSTPVSALAGIPRPDGELATARTGPFSFGGVYASSMTGNAQVLNRPVARGAAVTSYVRVGNDRPGIDSFKVKGVGSGAGYTVRYFRGTTDITAAVVAGSYTIENVPAGGFVDLKVKVTATTSTARGSSRAVTITVKSKTVKITKDVVQVRAVRS